MPKTSNRPAARDEVERCRRVRRALEQKHGGLPDLCDWLAALQERRDAMRTPKRQVTIKRLPRKDS